MRIETKVEQEITMLDYFAGQALIGYMSHKSFDFEGTFNTYRHPSSKLEDIQSIADVAYDIAERMLQRKTELETEDEDEN